MIDWTKPIETVDGRKARRLHESVCGGGNCVYTLPDPESCGSKHDIFLVDNNGVRCDDRAIYSKSQEPFIRNVKVKLEGWVNIYAVYKTEDEAKRACIDLDRNCHRFVKWEE